MNKLKSILFTLIAITSLTVLFTSCEKEPIQVSASDKEVVNELFQLASEQVDFSTNDETELYITLSGNDLSPSVAQAIQEQGLSISGDFEIENAGDIFCAVKDCPNLDNLKINANSGMVSHRGRCFTFSYPKVLGFAGSVPIITMETVTICPDFH